MKKNDKLYINLSYSKSSETRQYVLSSFVRKAFWSLSAVLCLLLIYSGYTAYSKNVDFKKMQALETENNKLKEKIVLLDRDLDSIMTKLEKIEKWEDRIRAENNLKEIPADLRKVGTGGYPEIDSTFSSNLELHTKYNSLIKKKTHLNNKLNFDLETHKRLVDFVEQKRDIYKHLPSIYPTYGRISSGFGYRYHPILKKKAFHSGIDFGNKPGTPIYSTAEGKVIETGNKKLPGKYVILKHKYGYKTKYLHMDKILVKKGDKVSKGSLIGEMGNTGRSTGPHLHYEIIRYGKLRNPWYYLKKEPNKILTAEL